MWTSKRPLATIGATMARLKKLQLERFCQEYISNGYNGAKAARSVGKPEAGSAVWASQQISTPNVLARIMEIQEGVIDKIIMSRDEVIAEMNKLATFDARAAYDEDGNLLHPKDMDASTASAIKEVDAMGGIKFLDNKRGALQDMMKYYNLYEEHQKAGAGEMHVWLDEKDEKA